MTPSPPRVGDVYAGPGGTDTITRVRPVGRDDSGAWDVTWEKQGGPWVHLAWPPKGAERIMEEQ